MKTKLTGLLVFLVMAGITMAQNAPITFEEGEYGATWTWSTFENGDNAPLEIVANPSTTGINTSATVATMTTLTTGQPWAGVESLHGSDIGPFSFDVTNSTVKVMVYKSVISDVGVKFAEANGEAQPEVKVANTLINEWEELTFDLSGSIGAGITGVVDQIIIFPDFDLAGRTTDNVCYFDNVSFSGQELPPAPAAHAPVPTEAAGDVISVFSDSYTNIGGTNFYPGWGQATVVSEVAIEGNNTLLYSGLNYQGIELGSAQDLTGMDSVHVDFWSANSTELQIFLISQSSGEQLFSLPIANETWVSTNIPLTHFSDLGLSLADIHQFKFVGNGDVYLDNIYFLGEGGGLEPTPHAPITFEADEFGADWTWTTFENGANDPFGIVANPDMSGLNASATVGSMTTVTAGQPWAGVESQHGADIGSFSWDATNSTVKIMVYKSVMSDVGIKFAEANGEAQPEIKVANTLVNEWEELTFDFSGHIGLGATGILDQIIIFPDFDLAGRTTDNVCYFDNITFSEQMAGPEGPVVAAPVPAHDANTVMSVYSEAYTNMAETNFNPNWGQSTIVTVDELVDGTNTLKYGNLNYQGTNLGGPEGVDQDVSGFDFLHIDFWTPNASALNFFLISRTTGEQAFALPITTEEWVSIDIPLTHFSDLGLGLTDIFQFKVDGGDGSTIVWFDNWYFHGEGTIGPVPGLFFSEYAEGSSSNKYVEIYNPTGADVDLSSYSVQGTNNGTAWGDNGERDIALSGILAAGHVYVIAADEASPAILDLADLALAYESPLHYNGDDGIALLHNGMIIDAIGVDSLDPGDGWAVAGVLDATKDHTLVRKNDVMYGNIGNWEMSAGSDSLDSQWLVTASATADYTPTTLGWHIAPPPAPMPVGGAWAVAPEAGALMVGPNPNDGSWWSNSAEDVITRACFFDDKYVFHADGSFRNVMDGDTWLETWQGVPADGCGAPVAPHDGMTPATYSVDLATQTVTLNGVGAYLGIPKAFTGGELGNPADAPASITYELAFSDSGRVMTVVVNVGGGFWTYKMVPTEMPPPPPLPMAGAWVMAPEAGALAVGPNPNDGSWWANSAEDVTTRACFFDDKYIFHEDGSFTNVLDGDTWLETWQGVEADGCGAPVAPHDGMTPATFSVDLEARTVTLHGAGSYLGIPKAFTGGELGNPADAPDSITYEISFSDSYEVLTAVVNIGGGFWTFKMVAADMPPPPVPMTAAPTPEVDEDQVLSIYSDAYTDLAETNFNPNWGQSTIVSMVDIEDNSTLSYGNLNYQGTNLGGAEGVDTDVSAYEFIHVDFWTANATELNFFLISRNSGEQGYSLPITPQEWVSIDIPLTHFTDLGMVLTDIFQFKVDGGDGGTMVWFDNWYFYTTVVGVDDLAILPEKSVLEQNYPNPFNPTTTIKYGLSEASPVSLIIYDIRGVVVRTMELEHQAAGWYELSWNGINDAGMPVSTGLYLTRFQAGTNTNTIKMLYLK